MNPINFSIIIPNYNGENFLLNCLQSLSNAIKLCSSSNFEIILIDNASTDNSLQIFKQFSKTFDTKSVVFKSNHGFAKAVNQGILISKYEYTVVCNNDLTIDKNWFKIVSEAIQKAEDSKVVAFFGLVLNKAGDKIESEGLQFFSSGKAININNNQPYKRKHKPQMIEIWGAPAPLIVYKKNILKEIGMFDEKYFAYLEDVDLSYRLRKQNYKTLYISDAISYHHGGGTSNRFKHLRQWMTVKNWLYFIVKNYSVKDIINNMPDIFTERLHNLSGLLKQVIIKNK